MGIRRGRSGGENKHPPAAGAAAAPSAGMSFLKYWCAGRDICTSRDGQVLRPRINLAPNLGRCSGRKSVQWGWHSVWYTEIRAARWRNGILVFDLSRVKLSNHGGKAGRSFPDATGIRSASVPADDAFRTLIQSVRSGVSGRESGASIAGTSTLSFIGKCSVFSYRLA